MILFGGAVEYEKLRLMPLPELANLHKEANRIIKQQKSK